MSLTSHIMERLDDYLASWALAIRTLPEGDLVKERDALRAKCVESIGAKPEALLLGLLNTEMNRRGLLL